MNPDEEKKIDLLLKEYEIISQEIEKRIGRSDKIIGYGLTILGVGIVYGLKEGINEIILAIPLGFFGVMFYAVFNTTIVMTLGGYRRSLGERINAFFDENILIWEAISKKLIHRCFALICLNSIYSTLLGLTIFISFYSTYSYYEWKIMTAFSFIVAFCFVTLSACIIKMNKAFDISYHLSLSLKDKNS